MWSTDSAVFWVRSSAFQLCASWIVLRLLTGKIHVVEFDGELRRGNKRRRVDPVGMTGP